MREVRAEEESSRLGGISTRKESLEQKVRNYFVVVLLRSIYGSILDNTRNLSARIIAQDLKGVITRAKMLLVLQPRAQIFLSNF